MKKWIRRTLNVLLILVLVFGLAMFLLSERESYLSRNNNDEAMQIAKGETEPPETLPQEVTDPVETEATTEPTVSEETVPEETIPEETVPIPDDPCIQELLTLDLDALREENEDVIGWICIPDTNISYPLLQWTDNEFYLTHSWQQTPNSAGSIFMEWQNSPDFTDFNTIIYGHRMREKEMFGMLHAFRKKEFLEAHPSVYILNDDGVRRYDIFAVQRVKLDSPVYGLGLETDRRKEELIRYSLDYSSIETGIIPTVEDQLLTLSTCSGVNFTTRWVVQCVLNTEGSYLPNLN